MRMVITFLATNKDNDDYSNSNNNDCYSSGNINDTNNSGIDVNGIIHINDKIHGSHNKNTRTVEHN